jgi:ribosome biogenesis GTPase / thiamine phosphate phosphatase
MRGAIALRPVAASLRGRQPETLSTMPEIDVERLRSIGMTPAQCQHLLPLLAIDADDAAQVLMRVAEVHRETLTLHDGSVERSARLLPRTLRDLADADTAVAVGDWVLARADAHGAWWVGRRLPPLTHVARRDADGRRHPVVSNADTALLVMGLDDDFNLRRLERYLALAHASELAPVVVLTKADVATPLAIETAFDGMRGRVAATLPLVIVDARTPDAAALLAPYLGAGQTLVVLGSSGAGKSTLTNTLIGAAVQDTGAVRAHDSRGKHTTTARSLHCLPGGACVIDTPGLRALRPDVDEATLALSFGDIERLAQDCRFRDCRHGDEPGCAVREGVAPDRLRNYHKLLREARRDTMSVLERQQQIAQWKARGRAGHARARAKRAQA